MCVLNTIFTSLKCKQMITAANEMTELKLKQEIPDGVLHGRVSLKQ